MRRRLALVVLAAPSLAGCNTKNSTLDPQSPPAHDISTLFWWMLLAAVLVFGGTLGWIALAFLRRRREGLPFVGDSERANRGLVLLFGVAIPIVALIGVFTVANFEVASKTDGSAPPPRTMKVAVTGRQWWWDIAYPGTQVRTANELHIPVGTRVDVIVKSADVIHSFWVPKLNRKIDMIPGTVNRVSLRADAPGRYYGQCAEYCGEQHAHMRLVVIAQPKAEFDAWVRSAEAPRTPPRTAMARAGEKTFLTQACASCHRISGTKADGYVGPDLTHLMQRASLAALTIPNTKHALDEWIRDPQHVKPGNRMPGLNLSARQYDELLAYLRGLD